MSIGRIGGGKIAVLRLLAQDFIDNNDENSAEQVEKLVDDVISKIATTDPIVPLPKIEDGSFARSEDLNDLVAAANASYAYLSAEADTLTAVTRMIAYLVNGRIDAAEDATTAASGLVANLQTYIKTKRGGSGGIVVDLSQVGGTITYENNLLMGMIKSSRRVKPTVVDIRSNGIVGNTLEMDITDTGTELDAFDIIFVDPASRRMNKNNLDDNDETTIFEVEAVEISPEAKDGDYIAMPMRIESDSSFEDIDYDRAPSGDELWMEASLAVPGYASMIEVVPALVNGQRVTIDSVSVSSDGKTFYEIARDFVLTPEANTYLDESGTNAGKGLFLTPPMPINYIVVRMKTSSSYPTVLAHAVERDTDGIAVEPVPFDLGSSKLGYFSPKNFTYNGEKRTRAVVGIPGRRWSIPVRNIAVLKNEYENTSKFETKSYTLPQPCDRVALSVRENIPDGCDISYEITPDEGKTWIGIDPIERSGGNEIVVFGADVASNPNLPSTAFVAVDAPVTTLRLRATLKSAQSATPSISSITIQPMYGG